MKKNGKTKYIVLVVLLLLIGVGYAYLTADLGLDGTAHIGDDEVLVSFKNVEKTNAENNIDPTSGPKITGSKNDVLTYNLKLDKNQVYEFTTDLMNLGENDAIIQEIETKVQIADGEEVTEFPGYFDYSLVNNDNSEIQANHELAKEGSEKIKSTLKLKSDISDENYDFIKNKDIKVTLTIKYVKKETAPVVDFATSSWDDIVAAYTNGDTDELEDAMEAGTTREIPLDLNGDQTNETKCDLRIANLSKPAECGTEGFSKTACGFVLECANIVTYYKMNSSNSNVGGWPATEMRTFLNSTVYNAFPDDLKSKMVDTNVISGHGFTETTNFSSVDILYLLSSKEVWQTTQPYSIDAYDSAWNNTRQLDYYNLKGVTSSNYSSAIKSGDFWWLRTADYDDSDSDATAFTYVRYNGSWAPRYAEASSGVSPAFRIGE